VAGNRIFGRFPDLAIWEQQDSGQGFRIARLQGKYFVFSAIGCFYEVIAAELTY
jgi:hypothetical protein